MKLTTWNWIISPAWYDQQNWFVLGAILMVICVVIFAIYMKGKHARQAGEESFHLELLNKNVVAPIGVIVLMATFFVYSMNAEITAREANDAAQAASADANIDRMERYYGIRNVSMANDDKDIMTTHIGMDTRHISGKAMESISNHQYDEQHDSRMVNITFAQNGKEYAGTVKSHAGVIQVFRNDGTILKPVNR